MYLILTDWLSRTVSAALENLEKFTSYKVRLANYSRVLKEKGAEYLIVDILKEDPKNYLEKFQADGEHMQGIVDDVEELIRFVKHQREHMEFTQPDPAVKERLEGVNQEFEDKDHCYAIQILYEQIGTQSKELLDRAYEEQILLATAKGILMNQDNESLELLNNVLYAIGCGTMEDKRRWAGREITTYSMNRKISGRQGFLILNPRSRMVK